MIRSPLVFDPPFDANFAGADFVVTVLANRKYGPVDQRPTAVEQALRDGETPFVEIGVRPLPDGGEVRIYEASGRRAVVRAPSKLGPAPPNCRAAIARRLAGRYDFTWKPYTMRPGTEQARAVAKCFLSSVTMRPPHSSSVNDSCAANALGTNAGAGNALHGLGPA